MGYCHRDRKQVVYVDEGERDMLKRDGKCFTNCNIHKRNYMQKLSTHVGLKKRIMWLIQKRKNC